jgi:hypothetical protein
VSVDASEQQGSTHMARLFHSGEWDGPCLLDVHER